MMQDILTSIKAHLYDRAASPLMGAFALSWAAWNYRFFVVLLSPGLPTPDEKFKAIDRHFSASNFSVWELNIPISGVLLNGIMIPAVLAFVYLFIYPLLAKPVYEHSLRKQRELRSIRQEQENQKLLSVEESREIYRRLAQMQSKHQSEIDSYNNQISSLNQHIEALESSTSKASEVSEPSDDKELDEDSNADLAQYDEVIRQAIENYSGGSFQLNQLFGQDRWSALAVPTRQALGKRFRAHVDRGDYVDVSATGKDAGNQQKYYKRI